MSILNICLDYFGVCPGFLRRPQSSKLARQPQRIMKSEPVRQAPSSVRRVVLWQSFIPRHQTKSVLVDVRCFLVSISKSPLTLNPTLQPTEAPPPPQGGITIFSDDPLALRALEQRPGPSPRPPVPPKRSHRCNLNIHTSTNVPF